MRYFIIKTKISYQCSECGEAHSKWQGKCISCGAWNSLLETVISPTNTKNNRFTALNQTSSVMMLDQVSTQDCLRQKTGNTELDRVLGGGLAHGSVVLIGGDPGIGKSTLLLQTMAAIANNNKVLYVSGEESVEQIALRASRLGVSGSANFALIAEININIISQAIRDEQPQVVVIDSIQTMYLDALQSAPGSVAQVRECASILTRLAKQLQVSILLVGHVTKDGSIAGPRVLEHVVDTVLYFEGDQHSNFRMLRSIKNRFGAVNELGVFVMTDKGLKEVNNPSQLFLSSYRHAPGSCILVTQEATRPLLVEVQALIDQSPIMPPKRLAVGMDNYRLTMLIAIMQRHLGLRLYDHDIFLNIVGGVKIAEPAIDLAVILAILSSLKNKPLLPKLAVFGEVGLSGEIRTVQKGQERIKEAVKLGFTTLIMPSANQPKQPITDITLISATNINKIIDSCFN